VIGPIDTVSAEGMFAGVMHECSVRFAAAGPWRMLGWASHRKVVGTCAICGQGIANVVTVTNGTRTETIGFDCATTLWINQDPAQLKKVKAAQSEHARQLRAARKAKRATALAARIGKCAALLMSERAATTLKSQPHPNAYWAEQGKTMFDYLGFCLRRCAVGACKMIEHEFGCAQ
jgi:hypothetical protein